MTVLYLLFYRYFLCPVFLYLLFYRYFLCPVFLYLLFYRYFLCPVFLYLLFYRYFLCPAFLKPFKMIRTPDCGNTMQCCLVDYLSSDVWDKPDSYTCSDNGKRKVLLNVWFL